MKTNKQFCIITKIEYSMFIIVHRIMDLTERTRHIFVEEEVTRGICILQLSSKTILSVIGVIHALLIATHSLILRRNTKTFTLV